MAKPHSRPIQSPRDAEVCAQEWMRYLGYRDAKVTQQGADRGIDVISESAVAQVKFWTTKKVGRPDIQMLKGAARGKTALFFSLSGYSGPAFEWANEEGVALFVFGNMGSVHAFNKHAERIERAARSLGPPLSDDQVVTATVIGHAIFGGVALLGTLVLIWPFGLPPFIAGMVGGSIAGLILRFNPSAVPSESVQAFWQSRIDDKWQETQRNRDEHHN
jgi:hypothetical protein